MVECIHIFLLFLMLCLVNGGDHTNEWAVHINGGEENAQQVANDHNFHIVSKIFDDTYLMRHKRLVRRSTEPSLEHHGSLVMNPAVIWAEQQIVKQRFKRDFDSGKEVFFNDPKWPKMWFLKRTNKMDMNVQKAWKYGMTGKDIVVTILDDGLERNHPDLIRNFDADASYDVNDHKKDPMPRYEFHNYNKHGTRCAGEVAAEGNNSICNVGIAYESSIGGVRMLDGDITDAVEAQSLSFNPQHIDIYSASWGPDDDGRTVDGPGKLARRAFIDGIDKGRQGKGSIFVWASGNGGHGQDNCNCDGYSNSIWTLSVSSVSEHGKVPWYAEFCTSTMATTFSSGSHGDRKIVTTDIRYGCTSEFTGTSASAPIASAICALALQANRALTWRDMQHIVQQTARADGLDDSNWRINGVGRKYSHYFGFGLMDAYAMVRLAKTWTTVSEQKKCEIISKQVPLKVPEKGAITLELEVKNCSGVNFIEHVQSKMSISSTRRGLLQISLTSPSGTTSVILSRRSHDHSDSGFSSWPFLTLHMWGENPKGIWKVEISQKAGYYYAKTEITEWSLVIYGTSSKVGITDSNADKKANIKMTKYNLLDTKSSENKISSVSSSEPTATQEGMTLKCEKPFINVDQKCLHFGNEPLSWMEGQTYCETYNSQLAELKDFKDLNGIMKNVHTNGTWIGGHKVAGGLWMWNSKEMISPSHWKYGHPQSSRHPRDVSEKSDRCLLLDPDSLMFMDHSCHEKWPTLCERN
ncbi:unnamed protein product [Meganyctiphanes norvegica]|uniref:furin n=1 Tax=Meganyctiphanes norvegica TaxID=48144 RepID=A0AAV2SG33_MEGNR